MRYTKTWKGILSLVLVFALSVLMFPQSVAFAASEDVASLKMEQKIFMLPEDYYTLNCEIEYTNPYDDYSDEIVWSSSDKSVATVDENGEVAAISAGTATIKAELFDHTATCIVTVCDLDPSIVEVNPTDVVLSKTVYNYTGKAKTPKVTIYDQNGTKISSKYYTVAYLDNVNAGTATARIVMEGGLVNANGTDYYYPSVTLDETFKIKAAKASKMKLSKTSYSFKVCENGIKPKVTVYDSKGKKISSKEYTVTYKNYRKPGTAKITVKMSENYGSKKFTASYKITLSKTTKALLPDKRSLIKNIEKKNTDAEVYDYLYYTKQESDTLKKMLPYGDLDVEFDTIYNVPPFCNENACFPGDRKYNSYTGEYLRESYFENFKDQYEETKFTGSISDFIQCVIHSPIVSVEDHTNEYQNSYWITCKDGSKYDVDYGGLAGFQYGPYSIIYIRINFNHNNECFDVVTPEYSYYAIIKVDKSKTPWGD